MTEHELQSACGIGPGRNNCGRMGRAAREHWSAVSLVRDGSDIDRVRFAREFGVLPFVALEAKSGVMYTSVHMRWRRSWRNSRCAWAYPHNFFSPTIGLHMWPTPCYRE